MVWEIVCHASSGCWSSKLQAYTSSSHVVGGFYVSLSFLVGLAPHQSCRSSDTG